MKKRILLAFLFALVQLPALAQVDTAWVRRYNGPANGNDVATALAVDDSGNVYVTGNSRGVSTQQDFATVKYSPSGDTLWVRRSDGGYALDDGATLLAVDDSGNVYVSGFFRNQVGPFIFISYGTLKYAPDGTFLWGKVFDEAQPFSTTAYDLKVDGAGYAYVTGTSSGSGHFDYTTIKYSPGGDTLWLRQYNGTADSTDAALALALDASGNIYVTGRSMGLGDLNDLATVKYSPAGDTLWTNVYNGPGNGSDQGQAIAVDDSGNLYVAGVSAGSGTANDYVTIKYSGAGTPTWIRRYNGTGNGADQATALSIDQSGNIIVTGTSPGSAAGNDYVTIKYSPAGDSLWVRRFNGSANGDDQANSLALDTQGNICVTGQSWSGVNYDYATIKYSGNGDSLWAIRYNGTGNGHDFVNGLAADESGNVYVTGQSFSTSLDYATIKYAGCAAKPGDANNSSNYTLADLIAILNYVFNRPGYPACGANSALCWLSGLQCRGDWNGNGGVSVADVVAGLHYLFGHPGGPWTPVASGACCLPVN